jgi:hypothetical protein
MSSGPAGRSLAATTATALLGGVVGGLLVAGWQTVTQAEADKSRPALGVDALRRQDLAELQREVAALRESLQRAQSLPPAVESRGEEPAALALPADYGPALAALTERLDRIALATHAVPWPADSFDVDPVKRDHLLPLLPSGGVPKEKWRFWTPAQLIDAYGFPSMVTGANGQVGWTYRWDDGTQVTFVVIDGMALEQSVMHPAKQ